MCIWALKELKTHKEEKKKKRRSGLEKIKTCKANLKDIESDGLKFYMTELKSSTLEFHVEIIFIILNLAH